MFSFSPPRQIPPFNFLHNLSVVGGNLYIWEILESFQRVSLLIVPPINAKG